MESGATRKKIYYYHHHQGNWTLGKTKKLAWKLTKILEFFPEYKLCTKPKKEILDREKIGEKSPSKLRNFCHEFNEKESWELFLSPRKKNICTLYLHFLSFFSSQKTFDAYLMKFDAKKISYFNSHFFDLLTYL